MILVLGGTQSAREIAARLQAKGYSVVVSVTTDYGAKLVRESGVEVLVEKLTATRLQKLIAQRGIKAVVDATHPFATDISRLALTVTELGKVIYIRWERPQIEVEGCRVIKVKDYAQAAKKSAEFNRILLTIGSRRLKEFTRRLEDWQSKLVVRLLPAERFIKKAQELGFSPDQIIGMQGPVSQKLNEVLITDYDIEALVTKASGKQGGLKEKLIAARQKEIPVILITRPEIDYRRLVNSWSELNSKLKQVLAK